MKDKATLGDAKEVMNFIASNFDDQALIRNFLERSGLIRTLVSVPKVRKIYQQDLVNFLTGTEATTAILPLDQQWAAWLRFNSWLHQSGFGKHALTVEQLDSFESSLIEAPANGIITYDFRGDVSSKNTNGKVAYYLACEYLRYWEQKESISIPRLEQPLLPDRDSRMIFGSDVVNIRRALKLREGVSHPIGLTITILSLNDYKYGFGYSTKGTQFQYRKIEKPELNLLSWEILQYLSIDPLYAERVSIINNYRQQTLGLYGYETVFCKDENQYNYVPWLKIEQTGNIKNIDLRFEPQWGNFALYLERWQPSV